jgi:hypothetical protein
LRMLGELFNKKDTIPKGFAGAWKYNDCRTCHNNK